MAEDLTEQLKSVASQMLSGGQLAAFLAVADAKRLAGEDGNIDATNVSTDLRTLYGISEAPQQPHQWGQYSGQPPGRLAGADARQALERRHGVKRDNPAPGPDTSIGPGVGARAALAKRHGGKR